MPIVTPNGNILKLGIFAIPGDVPAEKIDFSHLLETVYHKINEDLLPEDKKLFNIAKMVIEDYTAKY